MSCAFLSNVYPVRELTGSYSVYGQKERLLSIWPYLSTLPVLSHWKWSPLIHDAFEANREIVYPPSLYWSESQASKVDKIMDGLLVMHLRRGDFVDHCRYLAKSNSDWNAFNSFPELPDQLDQVLADARFSSENDEAYMAHCYPTMEQIVDKVKTVREASRGPLEYLYIMTNGDDAWVEELKLALGDLGGWAHIGSNRDLSLTWEQKFVAQALDMLVAQKAQVFIGNGVSRSLTLSFLFLSAILTRDGRFIVV